MNCETKCHLITQMETAQTNNRTEARKIVRLPKALLLITLCCMARLMQVFAQQPDLTEVLLDIPVTPIPVKANNKAHLLYELHVTNVGKDELELTRLGVFADQISNAPVVSYDSERLDKWLRRPGLAGDLPNMRLIGGGYRAVVFLNVVVDLNAIPNSLRHKLFIKEKNGREVSVESESVAVRREPVVTLGAPLRGDGWVALNGLGAPSHHRLSFLPRGGKAVVPQRYAIDWVRLGADGKLSHDNQGENKNYYGYGAEALAVADATVDDVRDGLPEMAPFASGKPGSVSFENATGNYVVLNLGAGRFALYAHLQPGSLRVKKGQRVRAGQVVGLVGSSGSSGFPHLHFHIVDANHPLFADGLPYVFHSFVVLGNVGSIDSLLEGKGITKQPAGKPDKRSRELPENLDVVSFP
jgi:murein DD-endopeptidase